MQRGHQVRKFSIGADQLVAQILGMRGHKAYARHAQGVHAPQKFRELAAAAAIGIDVLPQERDLLHALIDEALALLQHGLRLARTLPPAHIRHDAIGTEVVAAVHDVHKGGKSAGAPLRQALGNDAVALEHLHHRPPALKRPTEILGQAMHIVRAEHQIDERIHRFHPLGHALLLRHAAAHADEELRALLFQLLEPYDVAQGAILGVFAHAAGVVEYEIGFFAHVLRPQAHLHEHTGDGFRIAFVHLASHGDDMESPGAVGKIAHARGKFALAMKFAF